MKTNNFLEFINNKTLYYDKIDYDIIHKSWKKISNYIKLPYIIHIVGTNGKGSTGRYIASFLNQKNKNVVHYSSPHVIEFNERIWINGKNSSSIELQNAHEKLQELLDDKLLEKLTYFEYTTLMCFIISSNMDYLVLEAGLGGEFDATNVVSNNLTVVPTVGLDHIEFLGDTIEKIATTKLKSCDESYILGINIHKDVIKVKKNILKDKKELTINKDIILPNNANNIASYLKNNLILAINVLKYLNINISNLQIPDLFARCQKIQDNITIDVGHNLLAASAILKEFNNKKITLIYNSYKDKDYISVLEKLKPIINNVLIIQCEDTRICKDKDIIEVLNKLNIKYNIFKYNDITNKDEYLVFGSFKVVEEFLEQRKKYEK